MILSIPTMEEAERILKRKNNSVQLANQKKADDLILRCSREIREGNFTVSPVTINKDVLRLVQEAFKSEGWEVKSTVKTFTAHSTKKKEFDYQRTTLVFSPNLDFKKSKK